MARLADSPLSSMFANFNGDPDEDELRRRAEEAARQDELLSFDIPTPTNARRFSNRQSLADPNMDNPPDPGGSSPGGSTNAPCNVGYHKEINPVTGIAECVKDTTGSGSHSCPDGYEWEQGDDPVKYPNGRCKIIGMTWEESQGKVAPQWKKADTAPASSGGGGGSNSSGSTGGGIDPMLWDSTFKDLFAKFGQVKLPYDAAAIAELEGKLKASAASEAAQKNRALLANRATQGIGTSGRTNQGIRNNISEANQKFNTGMIDVNDNARRANYQAEINRLQSQLSVLDSQANLVLGLTNSATQRMSVQNQYAMERAKLVQQMEALKLQLAWGSLQQ